MTAASTTTVSPTTLRTTITTALAKLGHLPDECEIMADAMLYAETRGNSQGIIKLTSGGLNRDPRAAAPVAERNGAFPSVARLHGRYAPGMVIAAHAADLAIELASQHGIGLVASHEINSSSGALGYFTSRMARRGYIGISAAGTPPLVAPFGATERLLGTNPLSIALPRSAGNDPVVLDIATSAIAWYDVIARAANGAALPENSAIDNAGNPTTDAKEALKGALVPFGGVKGAGLSFMIELLCGAFAGAESSSREGTKSDWGALTVALRPDLFGPAGSAEAALERYLSDFASLNRSTSNAQLYYPGERGNLESARQASALTIDSTVYQKLLEMAGEAQR